ncbi:hypothetical protein MIMGU_mgv1a0167622mg, partial [Erythranthe guttata]
MVILVVNFYGFLTSSFRGYI